MRKLILLTAVLGLILGLLLGLGIARAEQSERCGSRIVSTGDHIEDVLSKCGQPDAYVPYVNRFGVEVAAELRYDNSGNFSRFFYFNGRGVCTRIRTGAERN